MKLGIAVKNSHFYPSKCFICEWCRSVCNNASHAARRGAPTPARICTCTLRRCYPIIIQWDLFYLSVIQSLLTRGNSFFCFVSDKTKNIGNTVCCYFFVAQMRMLLLLIAVHRLHSASVQRVQCVDVSLGFCELGYPFWKTCARR